MAATSYVIETKRFTLEPLTRRQAPLLAELGADPDVVKSLICDWSTPLKRLEIAEYWIEKNQEYGIWGVLDRYGQFGDAGRMIGFCGADEPLPLGGEGPEIYYAFGRETWGQGTGTEIAGALIDHLFQNLGVSAVEALVLAGLNAASGRLLEKLGMTLVGRYPLVEYVGDESGPTIRYELWRVETASPENARSNLEEAAFKIGQFVAAGAASEKDVFEALREAAVANGLAAGEGAEVVDRVIESSMRGGMAEDGWLHYRIKSFGSANPPAT
jgi:RimJ/RimL family protein N-acetyltransferase